jgi:hypothetical protein
MMRRAMSSPIRRADSSLSTATTSRRKSKTQAIKRLALTFTMATANASRKLLQLKTQRLFTAAASSSLNIN